MNTVDEFYYYLISKHDLAVLLFCLNNKIIEKNEKMQNFLDQIKFSNGIKGFNLDKNLYKQYFALKKEILLKLDKLCVEDIKSAPIEILKEFFCVKVFRDSYKNINSNLKTFHEAYQKKILKSKNEYKLLENIFCLLNSKDMSLLLKNLKKFNLARESLYDAFKEMQNYTFEDIKNTLYIPDEKDLDATILEKLGVKSSDTTILEKDKVKIYNIGKSSKKLLLHVTRINRYKEDNNYNINNDNKIDLYFSSANKNSSRVESLSLSYVDNSELKTFRDIRENISIVYGKNIPNDNLIAISNKDAYTSYEWPSSERNFGLKKGIGSPRISQKPLYLGAEDLLKRTNEYNEVSFIKQNIYDSDSKLNVPIAIFCLNKITYKEIKFAIKYNLPIIYSSANYKYKEKNTRRFLLENTDILSL